MATPATRGVQQTRATIEVAHFVRYGFQKAGLPNPKSLEIGIVFCMLLVVCADHGIFHPVAVLFYHNQFSEKQRGLKLSN